MEALEDASPEERARAVAAEWARLRRANDSPEPLRAFAARRQVAPDRSPPSAHSFLGGCDREFLGRGTQEPGHRLPAAQTRACAVPLQRAVALGDAALVRAELEGVLGGKDCPRPPVRVDDLRSADGETLLHTAVLHQHAHVVQTLLALGASPHVPLPPATTRTTLSAPLVGAAAAPSSVAPRSDNFRCSRLLHAGEATAVHYACAVGNLDILKLLLSNPKRHHDGVFRPPSDASGRAALDGYRAGSLLLWAIARGHAHIAAFLLRTALERDCSDEDGNNAFGVAALLLGHDLTALRPVLRVLAAHSADPETERGIDVNHRNALGLTAFDVAETADVREALARVGARTARVVPVERVLRRDREAFRRDVRLSAQDPRRPRAAFLRLDKA